MTDTPVASKSVPAIGREQRAIRLRRGLLLEWLTVSWNLIEGIVSVAAALRAGSVVLLGFGIDSFVECASGSVMIWRLRGELRHKLSDHELDTLERRARRFVGLSLFLLAAWVSFDAARALWLRDKPEFSAIGIAVTALSVGVMVWLARAKRDVARQLGSHAMEADSFQTTACWWLSIAALLGVGLNGLFGWWWADPLAAFAIATLIAREGKAAWEGRDCCTS